MALYQSRITDKIYHGCAIRYANGEKKLIDFERYLLPALNSFWKQPLGTYQMQTKNSTKKRQLIVGPLKYIKNLQD